MTVIEACEPAKNNLKTCLASNTFVSKMLGCCNDLKSVYEDCMTSEFTKMQQENLKKGREITRKWKERRESVGLP